MDWEDLKTFTEVATTGSVRKAARALGVHHSTVSRRVERLEADVATRLFDRRPEGFALTACGEELLSVARRFADELRDAGRSIAGRDSALSGRVTLTMAEPIAVHGFAPRLPEFVARFPELELDIRVTVSMLDISRGAADIAIRMDNNPPETLVGKRLFAFHETVYASPDYLRAHDPVGDPASARWLGWRIAGRARPLWVEATEFRHVPVWGAFGNVAMQQAAVRAGLGLAALPCYMADRDPGLVRATPREPVAGRDIWILTHPDLRHVARIRAVMAFAEEVLRADRALFLGA
ncbi:MAG: LysR family transcriptional regulator [Pseudomonadota bacterium]